MSDESDKMLEILGGLSDDELKEMLAAQEELERRLNETGPQTDEELHEWIKYELGIDIPRVAVCENHSAPFQFLSDLYFDRTDAALAVANRGGAKTFLVAVLHWLNARFKPGIESCVAADTLIDCPRDHRRFPGGIPISQIKPGQLVWTFNENTRRFELKPVVEARMTRQNAPIFKLTLDDGSVIRSTEDHKFMRRDGSWAELRDLSIGESLMPMYRDWEPYVRVRPDAHRGGGMIKEYDAVADLLWPERKGMHVDHVDERRENSDPENLQVLTPSEHCSKTMKGRNFGFRVPRPKTDEHKKAISEALVRHQKVRVITDSQRAAYSDAGKKGGSQPKPLVQHTCTCGETYFRPAGGRKGLCPTCKTEARTCPICAESYVVPRKSRKETCSRHCASVKAHQTKAGVYNHKIVSIEPDGSEDVWDMEVTDNHNFVVHGVVLHNCTFGAIEAQSFRAYAHLKNWVFDESGNKKPIIVSSLMRETVFNNGSKIEVLGSTPEAVNGPHPQIAHADEIELMRDDTWNESRNMTISKKIKDGRLMNPQDIATSTRKGPSGRVQQLIDEIEKAVAEGYKPPRDLYVWCIKETASQQKNCQVANPDLPEALRCPCNTIRKGEWEDGSPRLLRDVCNGDFHRSRGWQPFSDIVKQFTENDRTTFEVQQLCDKPEMRHHYVPTWRDDRHCIRNFEPDPRNGPIFLSVDWGGTNPHAVNWYQLLAFEIEVEVWNHPQDKIITRRLKEGTLVCFGEIYISEIGNEQLGKLVQEREQRWAGKYGSFRVYERFADPQGKAARMDWKAMGLGTRWHTTREFDEHIKAIRSMFDDDLFVVDGEACPMFVREIKAWRADPRTGNQIDKFNHCMSNFRYAVANIKKVRQRALSTAGNLPASTSIPRQATITRNDSTPVGFKGSKDEFDSWRKSLGEPVTRVKR